MNIGKIIERISSPDYISGNPLMQSRNGGKIHQAGCGQRSLYVATLKGTDTMTRQQIIDTYGTDLCRFCFPEIDQIAPAACRESCWAAQVRLLAHHGSGRCW